MGFKKTSRWIALPSTNYLAILFHKYMKVYDMTSEDVGKKLGVTAVNVRAQINKPPKNWRISDLERYCKVLNIPIMDALEAAVKS